MLKLAGLEARREQQSGIADGQGAEPAEFQYFLSQTQPTEQGVASFGRPVFAALPPLAEQPLSENSPERHSPPEPQGRRPGDGHSPQQETTIRGSEPAERAQQNGEPASPQTEDTQPQFLGPPGVFNFVGRPVQLSEANKSRAMSLFFEEGTGQHQTSSFGFGFSHGAALSSKLPTAAAAALKQSLPSRCTARSDVWDKWQPAGAGINRKSGNHGPPPPAAGSAGVSLEALRTPRLSPGVLDSEPFDDYQQVLELLDRPVQNQSEMQRGGGPQAEDQQAAEIDGTAPAQQSREVGVPEAVGLCQAGEHALSTGSKDMQSEGEESPQGRDALEGRPGPGLLGLQLPGQADGKLCMLTTGGGVPLNVDAAKMARMAALFADDFAGAPARGQPPQDCIFGGPQKKRPFDGLAASTLRKKMAGAGGKASPVAQLRKEAWQGGSGNIDERAANGNCTEKADRDPSSSPEGVLQQLPAKVFLAKPLAHKEGCGGAKENAPHLPSRLGPRGGALKGRKPFRPPPRLYRKLEPPQVDGGPGGKETTAAPSPALQAPHAQGAGVNNEPRRLLHAMDGGLLGSVLSHLPGSQRCRQKIRACSSRLEDLLSVNGDVAAEGLLSVSAESMQTALIQSGASENLASRPWVGNCLRWVLWKLKSLALSFPALSSRLLSPQLVLDEMKKRYEWEIGRGKQPILKRVLEQDSSPGVLMVLCVADIKLGKGLDCSTQLELTDGWYSIRAVVDSRLAALEREGKLKIGDKVRLSGAETSEGGQQMEALEATKSCLLSISYNNTHRVAADTKLGAPPHRTVITPLPHVHENGGHVSRTLVLLQRLYPIFFWRRDLSGAATVLTPRAHDRSLRTAESNAARIAEAVDAQLQAEEVQRCKAQLKSPSTPRGQRLYAEAVLTGECGADQGAVAGRQMMDRRASMELQRRELLASEMGRAGLGDQPAQCCRNLLVSAVLHEGRASTTAALQTKAIIRIWRASEDLDGLSEGEIYSVTNLKPFLRRGMLELQTTSGTHWQRHAGGEASKLIAHFRPRVCPGLPELPALAPGSDFNFLGVVVGVGCIHHHDFQSSQWVFLADASVGGDRDWLLAANLRAGHQAVDFLGEQDVGKAVSAKDLWLDGRDEQNALWKASGNENSRIEVLRATSRKEPAAELAQWAKQQRGLIETLTARVQQLMS